ncbi:hypothetical protein PMAYCL1PPCAC_24427 [Pristionchus mayeri]|uniref:26S proteasome non-ATPase regulatory subunit 4 n=1 Tax=Pristionchus mayeri TaxID=1317129 RepID=A0AAN5D1Z0_9BILA|nr:hypothetical protein PMAYCL1PPCAC_24427 [Pristionchus mayeri]
MVQESTMICVDNSEWTRNGDYTPTRLQAETDAANLIVQCKLRANPENAVGVLTMADDVCVLSTMTQENSKLFMKLHGIEPKGQCQFVTAIKVAHLALKHRQNRNHRMRIVLFVGSPMTDVDQSELLKLSKKLKKEKVQMDVICFGDPDIDNTAILNPIIDVLNGKEGSGSSMVVVGPGSKLTEAIASSPIIRGEDGAGAPVVGGMGGGFDGFDADDDPDLALALRVSLEEQRAREQANSGEEGGAAPAAAPAAEAPVDIMDMDMGAMSEEQQLEWALRMSMQDSAPAAGGAPAAAAEPAPMEQDGEQPAADDLDELMNDPDVLQQMINELPGEKKEEDKA